MEILNSGPGAIAVQPWEDPQGGWRLAVIVKVTWKVREGAVTAEREAIPIFDADVPHENAEYRSPRFESDRVPFKPRADIVMVGRARAPARKRVTRLDVTLRVGSCSKTVRVIGDRHWVFPSRLAVVPRISAPRPFQVMDLVYDRAFGGIDPVGAGYCRENLIGRGYARRGSPKALHRKPLPNLENPRRPIRSWKDRPRPVGFGFWPRGSMPRLSHAGLDPKAGTGKEKVEKIEVGELSPAFFNGAAPDLQVEGYLRGDEIVEVRHAGRWGSVRFRLPGYRPRIVLERWAVDPLVWLEERAANGEDADLAKAPVRAEELEPLLDTLVLIPDEGRFYQVFRGLAALQRDVLEVARVRSEPIGDFAWSAGETEAAPASPPEPGES
jgi:hypothetical protein